MIETVKHLWKFSEKRHDSLKRALACSFVRSFVTVSEFLAVMVTVRVLCGEVSVNRGIAEVAVLAFLCVVGNFASSYFEQTYTLKSGFYMVADQRVEGVISFKRLFNTLYQ